MPLRLTGVERAATGAAANAATAEAAAQQATIGAKPLPIQLPIGSEGDFKGVIDLIENKALVWHDELGTEFEYEEIPSDMTDQVHDAREKLIETCSDYDDELAELYRTVAPRVPVIAISYDQARRAGALPLAGVIHHGVDLDTFPMGEGAGDADGPYFLFLGRIVADKGVDHAARAVRAHGGRLLIAAKMRERHERRFFREAVEPLLGDDVRELQEAATGRGRVARDGHDAPHGTAGRADPARCGRAGRRAGRRDRA